MSVFATMSEVFEALGAASIPHALMGGLAAAAWGRPRTTLGYREGRCAGPVESPDFTQFWAPSGIRVDVFFARTDFEKEALASAVPARVGTLLARTVSADALVVYKLIAHRGRDLDDIEAIMLARAGELDWERIERWAEAWELEPWLAPFRTRFKR